MEELTAMQEQQLKKMSDERLRVKLVAHEEEVVYSWEREELLATYATVIVEGTKPKAGPVVVDLEVEKARLALERERFEFEKAEHVRQQELERQKTEYEKAEREKDRLEREKQLETDSRLRMKGWNMRDSKQNVKDSRH